MRKKSLLVLAGAMALTAFATPSMAPAATWGVVGSTHTLDGPDFSFNSPGGGWGATCTSSQFHVDVRTTGTVTVTAARFDNCRGTGEGVNCLATLTGTKLPWTVTGPTTASVQIHNVWIDVKWEGFPGCNLNGLQADLTGTLSGGVWNATQHEVAFTEAGGLTAHLGIESTAATVTATIRDTAQTLTLT
jgi:hypothetical protein